MAEWPKATVSKTVVGFCLPRVRIPVSPPVFYLKSPKVSHGITLWSFFVSMYCYIEVAKTGVRRWVIFTDILVSIFTK